MVIRSPRGMILCNPSSICHSLVTTFPRNLADATVAAPHCQLDQDWQRVFSLLGNNSNSPAMEELHGRRGESNMIRQTNSTARSATGRHDLNLDFTKTCSSSDTDHLKLGMRRDATICTVGVCWFLRATRQIGDRRRRSVGRLEACHRRPEERRE